MSTTTNHVDPGLVLSPAKHRRDALPFAADRRREPAELTIRLSANLRVPVRPTCSPRLSALNGAGPAATAARRHPAAAAA